MEPFQSFGDNLLIYWFRTELCLKPCSLWILTIELSFQQGFPGSAGLRPDSEQGEKGWFMARWEKRDIWKGERKGRGKEAKEKRRKWRWAEARKSSWFIRFSDFAVHTRTVMRPQVWETIVLCSWHGLIVLWTSRPLMLQTSMIVCAVMMACHRGVLKVDMNLGSVDIDQCVTGSRHMFADSHRCPSIMQVSRPAALSSFVRIPYDQGTVVLGMNCPGQSVPACKSQPWICH